MQIGIFSHIGESMSFFSTAPHARILQKDKWDKEGRSDIIPLTALDKSGN